MATRRRKSIPTPRQRQLQRSRGQGGSRTYHKATNLDRRDARGRNYEGVRGRSRLAKKGKPKVRKLGTYRGRPRPSRGRV